MAQKTIQVCDVCGVVKRDTNHWWKMALLEIPNESPVLVIAPASSSLTEYDNIDEKSIKDTCGQEHVQRLLDRYLNHGMLEEKEVYDESSKEVFVESSAKGD